MITEMKQKIKAILQGPVIVYPFLFAAFPIVFLYAHNIAEMSVNQIWLPLIAAIAATILLWGISSLILNSLTKAALATTIFIVLFFSYGRIYDFLENWGMFIPKHAYLLPATLLILGYCTYFIKIVERDFVATTKILNIIAVVLIAINLFSIGSYEVSKALFSPEQPGNAERQSTTVISSGKTENLPDIYFIILDEYAHPDTMREWYDYDNHQFINNLQDKGFFIADKSRTRTPHTNQAIAQMLNMEYLTAGWYWDETKKEYLRIESSGEYAETLPWGDITYRKIAYNKVADFLKTKGYTYIYFGNVFDINRWDDYMRDSTDLYFNYYIISGTPWLSEFQNLLWNTTILKPFYNHAMGSQYETAERRKTIGTIEHLKTLPNMTGPKFIFAWIICPHTPYVFGPNGEYIDSQNWSNCSDKQFYRDQYIFISTEIEKVVDELLEKSETPPIIILQSDHGLRPHHPGIVIGSQEWQKILNAMYLPGMDQSVIRESLSPVNTFRLIFNHYFNADYELLPDD